MPAQRNQWRVAVILVAGVVAAGCGYSNNGYGGNGPSAPPHNAQVVTATGDLATGLAQFRALLGSPANRTAGENPGGGRREINWDGVPAQFVNVDTFPGNFFNSTVPRGQIFSTPGSGLRVSDNALADEDSTDATQFGAFSPTKIFTAIGSPIVEVRFAVAGSETAATVNGFGVVFSDVDVPNSTFLEYYGTDQTLLKRLAVPVRSDSAGFSFAGAVFDSALVARVKIIAGQGAVGLGAKDVTVGGTQDLVAMDDFLSSEPHPIN